MQVSIQEAPLDLIGDIKKSGKAVPDPRGKDTVYYIPEPDELIKMNQEAYRELSNAEFDMVQQRNRALEYERSYEMADDSRDGVFFVYPLVRREVDFRTSWLVNALNRSEPMISIDPGVDRTYTVVPDDPEFGPTPIQLPAEEAIRNLEMAWERALREEIKISGLNRTICKELSIGKGPVWVKVGWSPNERYEKVPVVDKKGGKNPWNAIVESGEWQRKESYFPLVWRARSIFDMIYPIGCENYEDLPWIAEKTPMSQGKYTDLLTKYSSVVLLAADKIRESAEVSHTINDEKDQSRASFGLTKPAFPLSTVPIVERYFKHPVKYRSTDSEGNEVDVIEMMEMVGYYHWDMQSYVCVWFNDFYHQQHPYVPFFNDKRPFQLSDSSSTSELAPIQAWVTEAVTLTLEAKALANSSGAIINEDSPAWDYFSNNEISPGFRAPGNKDDVTMVTFGRDSESLIPEIEWLTNKADKVGEVRRGERVPGRTSPNTVNQIMANAVQQDLLTLFSLEESFSALTKLSLKVYRQYRPYGQELNATGENGEAVKIPLRVPVDLDVDELRIRLTAASEMAQRESGFEDLIMMANMMDQDAGQMAQIIQGLVDIKITDGIAKAFETMINRKQIILDELFSKIRIDAKKLTVNREMLAQIAKDREMIKQQAMQGAPMPPQQIGEQVSAQTEANPEAAGGPQLN
jgi:hypothetical protein